jgi:biofilm protein TabA
MYFDVLGNKNELPAYLNDAIALLRKQDLAALPLGRNELDGDRVYCMVMEYETKPAEALRFEAHARYIDVQIVYSGTERLDCLPAGTPAKVTEDRLAKDDVAFYEVAREPSQLVLQAGQFAVLHPGELHKPGGKAATVSKVRKIVLKVRAPS